MDRHQFLRTQRWLAERGEEPTGTGKDHEMFSGCASLHVSLDEQQPGKRPRRGARAEDAVHLSFATYSDSHGAELDALQM
eukprot:scaffold649667_cov42-Prasinocladus_malaysianus.AAC.1